MGGEGSGRKPDVLKMAMAQQQVPIANNGDNIFLPNYSGIKKEALKTSSTSFVSSTDDGTYITVYAGTTALFRIVKATGQMQVAAGLDTDTTL